MPEVTLRIPTPLQSFTDGVSQLPVEADSVDAALARAGERYPALVRQILARDRTVRRYVNIYVRRQDNRQLDGLDGALDALLARDLELPVEVDGRGRDEGVDPRTVRMPDCLPRPVDVGGLVSAHE